jgi:hypothetical protein
MPCNECEHHAEQVMRLTSQARHDAEAIEHLEKRVAFLEERLSGGNYGEFMKENMRLNRELSEALAKYDMIELLEPTDDLLDDLFHAIDAPHGSERSDGLFQRAWEEITRLNRELAEAKEKAHGI